MQLLHRVFSLGSLPVCLVEKPGSKCQQFDECSKFKAKKTNKTTTCERERIPEWILVCVLRSFPWGFRNFRMNNTWPLFLRTASHSPVSLKPKHVLIN